jgi:hypothetical protein
MGKSFWIGNALEDNAMESVMVTRLRTLLFVSAGASALLMAAGVAAAQTTSVTVPGMRLPAGSKVLNPGGQC